MRTQVLILLVLSFLFSCNSTVENSDDDDLQISFQPEDREILAQVLGHCSEDREMSISALMVKVGSFFLETPYVAHTLETGEEHLVVNLREMDCTTFAEYCLAIARTIRSDTASFEQFARQLQQLRYRDGIIEGYPSRLHYFCDWIYNNEQHKLIKDMSEEIARTPLRKQINFMSTHPDSYERLKEEPALVEALAEQEREITARKMFYIPENRIGELEDQLKEGDIAGITTGIEGLAIQHVVLLVRRDGHVHLLHASSSAGKVVVSEQTLEEYLLSSESASGIMLARPI